MGYMIDVIIFLINFNYYYRYCFNNESNNNNNFNILIKMYEKNNTVADNNQCSFS